VSLTRNRPIAVPMKAPATTSLVKWTRLLTRSMATMVAAV
jgi:hypothetical protein